jgi:hypothetical protein
MIDYSEGCHELKNLVHDLYRACLDKDYLTAKELCDQIVVTARLTRATITDQQEKNNV